MATVKQIDSLRPSNFPGGAERAPVTFSSQTGDLQDWYDASTLSRLQIGAIVALVPKQKGKGYLVADVQPSASPSPFPAAPPLAAAQRQAVPAPADKEQARKARRKYTQALVGEYAAIFQEVSKGMEDFSLSDQLLKDVATSLFIQTVRHFNL